MEGRAAIRTIEHTGEKSGFMVICAPPPVLGKPLNSFPYFLGDDRLMGVFENHLLLFWGGVALFELVGLGKCFKIYRMSQVLLVL